MASKESAVATAKEQIKPKKSVVESGNGNGCDARESAFHPDILAFGTHRDIIEGVASWQATQWDKVWPKTSDFRFDTDAARILVSLDNTMATVVVPWTSTGYHQDGTMFERPGRATLVFNRQKGEWLCTHSHMSLNRGVPQQSFAKRPVKSP